MLETYQLAAEMHRHRNQHIKYISIQVIKGTGAFNYSQLNQFSEKVLEKCM